ncbi:hypothetical protein SUGI_0462300 [Cryptomeria japonica]|nr:hypothetical protein SUGI_0462300 [Cryptomeria japonica]
MEQATILEIDYTGSLVINSFNIYAESCEANSSGASYYDLPSDGPFTISNSSRFLVVGCNAFGTYSFGGLGELGCVSKCDSQNDRPYCRYGCSEINLSNNRQSINFTGGGLFPLLDSATNKSYNECGFSTIFDPSTFKILDNKSNIFFGKGRQVSYGLRLNWAIGLENCSMAKETTNYSCSSKAECIDFPSRKGYVCRCLPGYEGNGYFNGTDCTDIGGEKPPADGRYAKVSKRMPSFGKEEKAIDERGCRGTFLDKRSYTFPSAVGSPSEEPFTAPLNSNAECIESPSGKGHVCRCLPRYEGNGYFNDTDCTDIDECSDKKMNMCAGEDGGGLQIAIETAEALAYLHSGVSQTIFHRDVKSSNILLNERLSPKLVDFGISRLMSTYNNTHLTTNIMGTRGYLVLECEVN